MILPYIILNILQYKYFSNIRINSLIHAIISSLGGILSLSNIISYNTQKQIVNYSIGYIIFDILIHTVNKKLKNEKYITYFHHSLFYLGTFYYDKYPELYSFMILAEISTIPLNLRFIYKNNSKLKNICSILFYINFFIFRILNNLYIYKYVLIELQLLKILLLTFSSLNLYWFYLMNIKLFKVLGIMK
jgi:hypothetical protein